MPSEKKIKIEFVPGQIVEGHEVSVDESTEKWSEYMLSDGTVLRGKITIIGAVRVEGHWDPQGNPMYQMNMAPTVVISSSPDRLKQRTGK
ncbi:hypothetical protein AB8Z38_03025 [Bradyrhizobium sp. LLZ17]|uniref:Uncharacterized protein n=1 Tax=Bradyrhizobium sp. LLZ17 TaxID=3239388 RepID=A0AB39XMV1_9BRAD